MPENRSRGPGLAAAVGIGLAARWSSRPDRRRRASAALEHAAHAARAARRTGRAWYGRAAESARDGGRAPRDRAHEMAREGRRALERAGLS